MKPIPPRMLVLSASISPVTQSRTRPTIGVIDRDLIQFYHTNRSVILVSSTINNGTGGLGKLVAIVISFSRLSLCDNGLSRRTGTRTFTTSTPRLCAFRKEGSWNLEEMERPGRPLSRLGSSSLASHRWLGRLRFVVNVFWPKTGGDRKGNCSRRRSEKRNVPPANGPSSISPVSCWPRMSPLIRVESRACPSEYKYERRLMRIGIIQERLYPLTTMTNSVKDTAQVLLDNSRGACSWLQHTYAGSVHRWL